jgi:hypothetical protein
MGTVGVSMGRKLSKEIQIQGQFSSIVAIYIPFLQQATNVDVYLLVGQYLNMKKKHPSKCVQELLQMHPPGLYGAQAC